MPRPKKPTFIAELPLVVSLAQGAVMWDRFEAARRLYNAVLGDALKVLALMRESKAWAAAKDMPKGESMSKVREARNAAFKQCNVHFGFTEYALHAVATAHKNAAGFGDRLGAHETQKIASRVFVSGSMLALAFPMVGLYVAAVGVATLVDRRRARNDPFAGLDADQASTLDGAGPVAATLPLDRLDPGESGALHLDGDTHATTAAAAAYDDVS